MRRIIVILTLILTLALSLCACGKDPEPEVQETVKYTITWLDENVVELAKTEVAENTVPSYTYNKADTAEWDYTVEGFSTEQGGEVLSAIPKASANATYYAVVSRVKQTYTVTFDTQGGTAVDPVVVEYGQTVSAPETAPSFEGHKFMGWSSTKDSYTEIDFTAPIHSNTTYYAIWNEVVDIKALLKELLSGYEVNPMSFLPESMRYDFSENIVDPDALSYDFSSFVDVDDIVYGGFGSQWNMILDNVRQSQTFFNVLSVVETLTSTSLATFNNYFDKNPDDTAHHNFASGIYSITVNFDGETISYVLDYTADLPVFGNQTIQIALAMNAQTKDKVVRMQIGDANALRYTVSENSYEFAIRYLGIRRAKFSVQKDANNNITGHINEFLVVKDIEVASAADFYTEDGYLYAVGNKADAFLGATGYICEAYDMEHGRLVGYEVEEITDVPIIGTVTFNTLWFNLCDISGITSIKYREADTENDIPAAFFINGSATEWANKTVGGGLNGKALSRRFDIEFRTFYYYSYDATNKEYTEHAVSVPMFFVQEENFDDLVADVKAVNKVTMEVSVSDDELDCIMDAYDTYVPEFAENKANVTTDDILAFIGTKVEFTE